MIYPLINYRKVITSTIAPYEYFKRIERLDLNEKIANKYNLVSSLEAIDPPTIKFRNRRNRLNKIDPKYFSSAVIVTFDKSNNLTSVLIVVKSNPIYYFLFSALLVGFVIRVSSSGIDSGELGVVVFSAVVAVFEVIAKLNILSRVESIVK